MYSEKVLYAIEEPHGQGNLYFIWQKGEKANLLATTGSDGSVTIFNKKGQLVERILLAGYNY